MPSTAISEVFCEAILKLLHDSVREHMLDDNLCIRHSLHKCRQRCGHPGSSSDNVRGSSGLQIRAVRVVELSIRQQLTASTVNAHTRR